ncbi:60S acidic ribosomal protein P2-like [Herpailurus yagouaroundi]|uniref:60S acidic ribosomal protein P2-like n=1 Tax=Herpailurus yagouaroundi TaxID=1608482 RepID=UPI001AD64D6C|nr:60S acidic ribosomal protein P2-like [Puma yagouaroundi]
MPPPSAKDIKKILDSMGIEADDDLLDKVICELTGKSTEDLMAQGIGKLASVTAGGAVAIRASPGSATPSCCWFHPSCSRGEEGDWKVEKRKQDE